MKLSSFLTRFKKKAISPVIAAVLLIGLVVMGSAVLMFMVLPLLNPAAEFEITSAYLFYDNDRTITYQHGVAEVRFSLQQVGTAQVDITAVKLYYAETGVIAEGTEIELVDENGDGAWIISMQPSVTTTTSQEITTTGTNFVMRFRLPDISEDTPLDYKLEVYQANGQPESTSFGDDGMNLGADAPRVELSLDQYIRKVVPLSASATDTHGGVANVTYNIYNDAFVLLHSETVDSQPFSWNWNTRDSNYPNGNYTVEVIAKDYAGWDDTKNITT
ncbi:MAG: Ig-like domain-containing protein, partial [Candidatus Hodarchaeales archaeon]